MNEKETARSVAAVVGAAMVLTACGGGNNAAATTAAAGAVRLRRQRKAPGAEISQRRRLSRLAQASDVVTLDPAGQQDTTSGVLMKHVYSTLMDVDDDGNLVPDLAGELRDEE